MLRTVSTIAAGFGLLMSAEAGELHLGPDRYWIAIASRQVLDEAVTVARQYPSLRPMVVRSVNGWYAVVSGPQPAGQAPGRAVLDPMVKSQAVPRDAYFTRGDGYVEVVWTTPNPAVIAAKAYDGQTDAALQSGDLDLRLSKAEVGPGRYGPVLRATYQGRPALTVTVPERASPRPASVATVAYLDQSSPSPQVVFTVAEPNTTCCTLTRIATLLNDGRWVIVEADPVAGSKGYAFEHLNSPGSVEMTAPDQAFVQTFGARSESVAPTRIRKLIVDQIVDVTHEPQYRGYLVQALAGLEASAKADERLWHNNGFLAGWVGAKMLVGQGTEAWSTMLKTYDRNPGFGPEECSTGQPIASCPPAQKVRIDFPIALKTVLIQHGYMPDADLYPVPSRRVSDNATLPASGRPAASIARCGVTSDAARTLIYQSFVGRRIRQDESFDVVTLQDDAAVETADPAIGGTVCSVSYAMDLRRLVGRLAQDGETGRAALVSKLMQGAGPTASNRIKFSVKPTSTRGQAFVELLP